MSTRHESAAPHDERHDEVHAERLFALGAGDVSLRAAFEASDLAACEECRALVTEFEALGSELDGAAADEHELARRARGHAASPGEARAFAEITRRARRPRRWPAVAAAAAVFVALVVLVFTRRDPGGTQPLGPGAEVIELVAPVGADADFAAFTWRGNVPVRGAFRVRVTGTRTDGSVFVVESPRLDAAEWRPDPGTLASWPAHVRWEVQVLDGAGAVRASAAADATRRAP